MHKRGGGNNTQQTCTTAVSRNVFFIQHALVFFCFMKATNHHKQLDQRHGGLFLENHHNTGVTLICALFLTIHKQKNKKKNKKLPDRQTQSHNTVLNSRGWVHAFRARHTTCQAAQIETSLKIASKKKVSLSPSLAYQIVPGSSELRSAALQMPAPDNGAFVIRPFHPHLKK